MLLNSSYALLVKSHLNLIVLLTLNVYTAGGSIASRKNLTSGAYSPGKNFNLWHISVVKNSEENNWLCGLVGLVFLLFFF